MGVGAARRGVLAEGGVAVGNTVGRRDVGKATGDEARQLVLQPRDLGLEGFAGGEVGDGRDRAG